MCRLPCPFLFLLLRTASEPFLLASQIFLGCKSLPKWLMSVISFIACLFFSKASSFSSSTSTCSPFSLVAVTGRTSWLDYEKTRFIWFIALIKERNSRRFFGLSLSVIPCTFSSTGFILFIDNLCVPAILPPFPRSCTFLFLDTHSPRLIILSLLLLLSNVLLSSPLWRLGRQWLWMCSLSCVECCPWFSGSRLALLFIHKIQCWRRMFQFICHLQSERYSASRFPDATLFVRMHIAYLECTSPSFAFTISATFSIKLSRFDIWYLFFKKPLFSDLESRAILTLRSFLAVITTGWRNISSVIWSDFVLCSASNKISISTSTPFVGCFSLLPLIKFS